MRLEALKIRNLGPFRDLEVELDDYEGQTLIAVVGPNGAGKSTLLELALPGAMYRSTPTRGSLVDLATARDAMLEARVHNGSTWTLRHLVDKVSGKSEAVVIGEDGLPVLDSAKVREFDGWAARHLPSPEVLFTSIFGTQGDEGFLSMKPSERKAVLLRALGLERLEALAANARERAREARGLVEQSLARLAEAQQGVTVEAAQSEVEAAEKLATSAAEGAAAATRKLEMVRLEASDYALARNRYDEEMARRARLEADVATKARTAEDLRRRIANNRAVLADADAIRAAERELEELRESEKGVTERELTLRHELDIWERSVRSAKESHARYAAHRASIEAEIQTLAREIELAGKLEERRERLEDRIAEVRAAELELEELSKEQLTGSGDRIALLRQGLESIRDSGDAALAGPTLEQDDVSVARVAGHPARVDAARRRLADARESERVARVSLAEAERAAMKAELEPVLRAELAEVVSSLGAASETLSKAESSVPAGDLESLTEELERIRKRIAEIEPEAKRASPLASAEARVAELEPQLTQLEGEIAILKKELGSLSPLNAPQPGAELASIEAEVKRLQDEERSATAHLGAAQARLGAALVAKERAEKISEELTLLEEEHSDWVRLSGDLGRDGLQAAEIDAAGPELTVLVNDLLHTCVGPRWTVSIETTRLSADGKKQLEGCDVRVVDTERGRDAEASTFSGGERVMIGEAVSLALSMLACRRAGLSGITLVRDESGAALDAANARAYVAMLRRAAELVGARHVLFVSHSAEVQELADARIDLGAQ